MMRAQFTELMVQRLYFLTRSCFVKMFFKTTSKSSELPSAEKTWTFSSKTVVICRSCTLEQAPLGKTQMISIFLDLRTLSIAALPVSPEVATITVTWLHFFLLKYSINWATQVSDRSLNASVGPCQSSATWISPTTFSTGIISSWSKTLVNAAEMIPLIKQNFLLEYQPSQNAVTSEAGRGGGG